MSNKITYILGENLQKCRSTGVGNLAPKKPTRKLQPGNLAPKSNCKTFDNIQDMLADILGCEGICYEGVTYKISDFVSDQSSAESSDITAPVTTTVTLNKTQIVGNDAGDLAHADGAVLIAAPGAGKAIQFLDAVLIYDYDTADYTGAGSDDLVFRIGSTAVSAPILDATILLASADATIQVPPLDAAVIANDTINLKSTAVTDPGVAEVFTLTIDTAETTGGDCELTINGVAYSDITIPAGETADQNAATIDAYITANITTHTSSVATNVVTVTSTTVGAETNAAFDAGTCSEIAATPAVTVAGVDAAAGIIKAIVTYRTITTGL